MTSAATKQQLEEHLASVEAQVAEIRRVLATGSPCDRLLPSIGAVQAILEQAAELVPSLCGDRCQFRLTPDQFSAEFERAFGLRIRGYRIPGSRTMTPRRAVPA